LSRFTADAERLDDPGRSDVGEVKEGRGLVERRRGEAVAPIAPPCAIIGRQISSPIQLCRDGDGPGL
jgi:hypothetical protein